MIKRRTFFSREEAVEVAQRRSRVCPSEVFVYWDGDHFRLSWQDPRSFADRSFKPSDVFFDGEPA